MQVPTCGRMGTEEGGIRYEIPANRHSIFASSPTVSYHAVQSQPRPPLSTFALASTTGCRMMP